MPKRAANVFRRYGVFYFETSDCACASRPLIFDVPDEFNPRLLRESGLLDSSSLRSVLLEACSGCFAVALETGDMGRLVTWSCCGIINEYYDGSSVVSIPPRPFLTFDMEDYLAYEQKR